jgi:hypothetical protein
MQIKLLRDYTDKNGHKFPKGFVLNIANEVGREMLTKNFAVQVVRGKTDDELIKDLNKSDEAGE